MKKKIKNQYKTILTFIVIFSMVSTVFINVSSADVKNNNENFNLLKSNRLCLLGDDYATKPDWEEANSWEYDMDFTFDAKTTNGIQILNVDGKIPSMIATLGEKDEEEYILDLNGNIDGDITVSIGKLDVTKKDMSGTIGGNAYIGRNDLSMREFVFEVDGKVGPIMGKKRDLSFDMTMNFEPKFDFFDFPIEPDEGIWQVVIDKATLEADVYIDIFGGISKEISEHTDFIDNMSYKGKENVKNYECFKIGGDWGNPSNLWYAPEAGFLAKVRESIDFSGKSYLIIADFKLDLINTTYDPSNKPPNKPQILSGPDEGLTEETYTFTFNSTDHEKDPISYRVDWGDGTISDWTEYHDSDEIVSAEHSWSKKGSYNVKVQAKDESGASDWSDSKSVLIKGDPMVNVTIISIEKLDEIDLDSSAPEWYYNVTVDSINYSFEDKSEKSNDTWRADDSHEFYVSSKNVSINIKLMEDDVDKNDIADISNRSNDDGDPGLLGTQLEGGRVFKIKYDLVEDKIISGDRTEKSNPDQDTYFPRYTSGEWDGSGENNPEDFLDNDWKQDDANLCFNITNDYIPPIAKANITNKPENIRPGDELQFVGSVNEGAPPYNDWHWDFGDGKISNEQNPKHSYETSGTYNVKLTVTDGFHQSSTDSSIIVKVNENQAPVTSPIDGPSQGKKGETYTYTFLAEDPEGDNIQYFVDWGDGTDTGWTDKHLSGTPFVKDHSWDEQSTYTIKFRARDDPNGDGDFSDGMISDWETLEVSMPKNKVKPLSIFYYLFRDKQYESMLDFLIYLFF